MRELSPASSSRARSRAARSYLLHVGRLDWTKINPDIFGSMIQAVAEDEERGAQLVEEKLVQHLQDVWDARVVHAKRLVERAEDWPSSSVRGAS